MCGRVIEEWQWDDANIDKLASRGLTRKRVLQVANEAPKFRRNKRGRSATTQMIGPDVGGTTWTVCIAEVPWCCGLWRAITGWRATSAERTWYGRA